MLFSIHFYSTLLFKLWAYRSLWLAPITSAMLCYAMLNRAMPQLLF